MFDHFLNAFATLFVTIDPIGNVPIFMALISGFSTQVQRAIVWRASLIGFAILLVFAFVGNSLLNFLGISLPALQITGGLLLLIVAIDMVFERRTARRQQRADEAVQDPEADEGEWQALAVFPLAIPMLAGAGAMTSLLVVSAGLSFAAPTFYMGLLSLCVVFALFTSLMLMTIYLGNQINKQIYLVLTRIMGVILAALSTQFIIGGIQAAFNI